MLPPSDLSNAVDLNSIPVMSARPRLVANPPIAHKISGAAEVLSLPVHPYLNKRNLEFISKNIKDILND